MGVTQSASYLNHALLVVVIGDITPLIYFLQTLARLFYHHHFQPLLDHQSLESAWYYLGYLQYFLARYVIYKIQLQPAPQLQPHLSQFAPYAHPLNYWKQQYALHSARFHPAMPYTVLMIADEHRQFGHQHKPVNQTDTLGYGVWVNGFLHKFLGEIVQIDPTYVTQSLR